MTNNPDIIKKAKKYVRRYKIWNSITIILILAVFSFITVFNKIIGALFLIAFLILWDRIGLGFLYRVCIQSVLIDKIDPETYLAIMCHGKMNSPLALERVSGEYYLGNYKTVMDICQSKLNDPEIPEEYHFYYLIDMANVYFDLGDTDNLRNVCERYEESIAKKNPKLQNQIRKRFFRMTFYDRYVNGKYDECENLIISKKPKKIQTYRALFIKARLAEIQGKTEEARGYYEILIKKGTHLNGGKLAKKYRMEMDGQETGDLFSSFDLSGESSEVIDIKESSKVSSRFSRSKKPYKILKTCFIYIVLIILFIFAYQSFSEQQDQMDPELYREEIRVLLEKNYDEVEVFDTFEPMKDGEIVDAMFLCKIKNFLLVGSVYYYEGEADMHYKEKAIHHISTLLNDDYVFVKQSFSCVTSDHYVNYILLTNEDDIPEEYYHLSAFELEEKTLYLVITDILPYENTQ